MNQNNGGDFEKAVKKMFAETKLPPYDGYAWVYAWYYHANMKYVSRYGFAGGQLTESEIDRWVLFCIRPHNPGRNFKLYWYVLGMETPILIYESLRKTSLPIEENEICVQYDGSRATVLVFGAEVYTHVFVE